MTITAIRECDECDEESTVEVEHDDQPETQDYNESWTCPRCGFVNNLLAVPVGED